MAKLTITFNILMALAGLAAAADYCGVCSDHTMCKLKSNQPGAACVDYRWSPLTAADKQAVTQSHNKLRNKVALGQETRGRSAQPSASNMRKLSWDDEAAAIAQRWANQCNFKHDTCRNSINKQSIGQNIFIAFNSAPHGKVDWDQAVENWYSEVDKRDGSGNTGTYQWEYVTGHYTQVVWAETTAVGCGYADYKTQQNGQTWNARLIVCNYKPGGNLIGGNMYEGGSPASKCPSGTRKDATYPGLCA